MKALLLLVLLAGIPGAAFAQAAIAGSVTDPSDAPIPGVLVEASSPALIEKARTAVTDGSGQYRIEDLRPGVYRVSFTLAGWRPYQQDDVELRGSLTTSVNAQLLLGPLTDSITVTGNVPVVDVHGVKHEVSLTGEVVKSIPTVRSYNALLVLVPGVVTNVNDIVTGTATTSFPIHGGRTNEGRLSLDGLTIGSPPQGNSATSYVVDAGNAAEVTFTTAGALGETETAGLVMNIVPRNGSNTTHGSFFVSGTGAKLQSDNLTPALREQGVTASTPLTKVYDVWGAIGGPISEGPRLVLRQRARRRQHDEEPERLLQPECRRSEQLAVCAGSRSAVVLRPDLRERQRPCHVAGDSAPQGQRLLGCAGLVPNVYRRHAQPTRNLHECRRKPWACSAGDWTYRRRHGRGRSRIDCSWTRVLAALLLASATSSGIRTPRAI